MTDTIKKSEAAIVAEIITDAQPEDAYEVAYSYGWWVGECAYFEDGSVLYWDGESADEIIFD